jgi:hypothetical protein
VSVRRDRLVIPQGSYWEASWRVRDAAGVPVADLSGWSVRGQIRPAVDSATVLHEWNTTAGNVTLAAPVVTLLVLDTDSENWTWQDGVYDIEVTDPGARVYRIAEGDVFLSREVTRDPGRTPAAALWTGAGAPGSIPAAVTGDDYLDTVSGDVYTLEA